MSTLHKFTKNLKKWKGEEVDILLTSGNKLDNVKLKKVKEGIIIAEGEREHFLLPPTNIDYIKVLKES